MISGICLLRHIHIFVEFRHKNYLNTAVLIFFLPIYFAYFSFLHFILFVSIILSPAYYFTFILLYLIFFQTFRFPYFISHTYLFITIHFNFAFIRPRHILWIPFYLFPCLIRPRKTIHYFTIRYLTIQSLTLTRILLECTTTPLSVKPVWNRIVSPQRLHFAFSTMTFSPDPISIEIRQIIL